MPRRDAPTPKRAVAMSAVYFSSSRCATSMPSASRSAVTEPSHPDKAA